MNQIPPPQDSRRPRSVPEAVDNSTPPYQEVEEINLGEWFANFWEGRYIILTCLVLFTVLGIFTVWKSTPIYQIEAMLTVQAKKERSSDPAFTRMEGLFSDPTDAQAEIEILKSNLVLGRTAEALNLEIVAGPKLPFLIGNALNRRNPAAPKIEVQTFTVPEAFKGKQFKVIAQAGGAFQLISPAKALLASGRIGDMVQASFEGGHVQLQVRNMTAQPGQVFQVARISLQSAIASIRPNFDAYEKSKGSNVLGLIYKHPSQVKGTAVLTEIVNQYIRHKVEKRGGESAHTLELLQAKMPMLKAKLEEAESRLNSFRSHSGSVDLNREADLVLQQTANLSTQVTALKQKKEDLLRTYKENADVVVTLNEQLKKLQSELGQADSRARALPGTQQTVIRLTRDVQVNQELYTALLNNIQQLQVSAGSDLGNFDLVDSPTASSEPIGPKPTIRIAIFAFAGLIAGAILARVRRILRRGIKDHRLIESKLGMPVLVTIPHSKAQDEEAQAIRRREEGAHLLVKNSADDLASESLRSLRTVLHFSMKDSANNVVMITGPSPSIGKSFISANFATTMAQAGNRVILVDGDLRKGNLHHYFGIRSRQTGFSDVLAGRCSMEAAVRKTEIPGLDMVTTGFIPPNPSELLISDAFSTFLKAASEAYDYVIIDAPPLLAVTDATIIGSRVGAVLLVAKYAEHPLDELRACQSRLHGAGVPILGCVFNDILASGLGVLGGNYHYSYHYTYKG